MNLIYLLIALGVSFPAYKALAGSLSLSRLNLFSGLYYFNIMLMTVLGAYIISMGWDDNPALAMVPQERVHFAYYAILYSIVVFPFAALVGRFLVYPNKSSAKIYDEYAGRDLSLGILGSASLVRVWLIFLTVISLFSAIYVTFLSGGIPQTMFFSAGDQVDNLTFRVEVSRRFAGIVYIKTILFEQMTIFLSLVIFGYWLNSRLKIDFIWFFVLFILSVYSVTFSLSKSQLIVYLAYFVFYMVLYRGGVKIGKAAFYFMTGLALLYGLFYVVTKGDASSILIYMFNRFVVDQVSGTFLMFDIYPRVYGHIGLCSTVQMVASSLCQNTTPAARVAMEYAFPVATELGIMNLLSTYYLGEAWANYGLFGVLFAPIYVGMVVSIFYFSAFKFSKNPFALAYLSFISFGTGFSIHFNGYVYNSLLWATLLIVYAPYVLFALKGRKIVLGGVK